MKKFGYDVLHIIYSFAHSIDVVCKDFSWLPFSSLSIIRHKLWTGLTASNKVQSNQLYGQQGKNLEVPMVDQHESWLKKNHS
jgi:hypothetical protein